MATFSGVWLPIITPFIDGEIDYAGYEKLIDHYLRAGVAGIIPLGTTGESPTIDEVEAETLVERTVAAVAGRVPVLVGVGANDTRKVVKAASPSAPTTTGRARTGCGSTSRASPRRPTGRS